MSMTRAEADAMPVFSKECGMCHKTLPSTDFSLNLRKSDGRHNYCRECQRVTRDPQQQERMRRREAAAKHLSYTPE